MWRSETLKSIVASSSYKRNIERETRSLSKQIFKSLGRFLPSIQDRKDSLERLHDQVVLPTVKLAVTMKTSSSCYKFYPAEGMDLSTRWDLARTEFIHGYKFVDLDTRKTLKSNSFFTLDENGNLGKPLFLFEPGLARLGDGMKQDVQLYRPSFLLKLYTPLGKRP